MVAGQIGPKPNRPQVKSAPVKSAPDQIIVLLCFFFYLMCFTLFSHREITCPPFLLFTIVNMKS